MHVQVTTFNLKGATEEDYRALCEQLAPTYAAMPGLVAKYWIADAATNTYGGVLIWESDAAMRAYGDGEVWAAVAAHPNLANIAVREYGVLDAPTRITRGLAEATVAR